MDPKRASAAVQGRSMGVDMSNVESVIVIEVASAGV